MTEFDKKRYCEGMKKILRQGGEIIKNADRSPSMVEEKSGRANFVTTYDKKVQDYLQEEFASLVPEAVFVGEEEDIHSAIEKGLSFIVDPIDGTTNFIKDYRVSCISAALLEDGIPQVGVIYNPYLDEMFSACKGLGAQMNERTVHVSTNSLKNGIVLFGTSPYYSELSKKSFELAYSYFEKSLDIRRSGSAAIDLCSIAAGRAELFFECLLSPWDYAAGSLIVEEAGGRVTAMDGNPLTFGKPCSVLATNNITEEA